VSETTEAGGRIRDYFWHDNGEAKAQVDDTAGVDSVVFLHSDHLMTARIATDPEKQIVWRWEGQTFGDTDPVELTSTEIN
jgi:hypothetical protein